MIYSFFRDVPKEILEAARIDGAQPWQQLTMLLVPLALPGIASTALLSIILCWNEAFWSINLTATQAPPADRVHRLVLQPRGPVLGQAFRRVASGHRADRGFRFHDAAAVGARPTFGAVK